MLRQFILKYSIERSLDSSTELEKIATLAISYFAERYSAYTCFSATFGAVWLDRTDAVTCSPETVPAGS
jgi:hypothetical protein